MKKILKDALKAHDLDKARTVLVEMMTKTPGNVTVLEDIRESIEKTPDLFQVDDGKFYARSAEEMTETLIEELRKDLTTNFSLPKYRLYTEVQALKNSNPKYYNGRQEVCGPIRYEIAVEAIEETVPALGDEECYAKEVRRRHRISLGRGIGLAVIIAGLVASIVGICVPVRFMIGLGIGVLMLGATVVYTAINRLEASVMME